MFSNLSLITFSLAFLFLWFAGTSICWLVYFYSIFVIRWGLSDDVFVFWSFKIGEQFVGLFFTWTVSLYVLFVFIWLNFWDEAFMCNILCVIFRTVVFIFIIFTNPSARAGYDTRSIFKRSLTGLNSEFSFS